MEPRPDRLNLFLKRSFARIKEFKLGRIFGTLFNFFVIQIELGLYNAHACKIFGSVELRLELAIVGQIQSEFSLPIIVILLAILKVRHWHKHAVFLLLYHPVISEKSFKLL